MTAVDTNVLVRVVTRDDPSQVPLAVQALRAPQVFISRTVLLETAWVLASVCGRPGAEIVRTLRNLAGLPNVVIEDAPAVARALAWAEAGMDLADAFHLAAAACATTFVTFDRALAKSAAKAKAAPRVKVPARRGR